jgi:hypothetical protein
MARMARSMRFGAVVCCASAACGQAPPNYDFQWSTIGAPGNRAVNQEEGPRLYPPYQPSPIITGDVGYEYRMTTTEVRVTQWLDFLNAYWPHAANAADPRLRGRWIGVTDPTPGHNPGYFIQPAAANYPADVTWQNAARYVNWLNNGKGTSAAAFTNGAYDTSTFTQNPDGSWNDQPTHNPGAQFWIPTLSEWTKGMYYDPNKNGPGQGGYYRYETSSDEPPIPGWPWEGGQTSAGLELFSGPYLDVGSYPWVTSPWGLLDGSGSAEEWTEYKTADALSRVAKGSYQFQSLPEVFDAVDHLGGTDPHWFSFGFRVASVPTPSVYWSLFATILIGGTRRKR